MFDFIQDLPARRVVFRAGAIETLGDEITRLGIERGLVITTERGRAALDERWPSGLPGVAATFDQARVHVPVETQRAGISIAQAQGIDGLIAFGGGSAIGLAKAIALHHDAPIIAVPTTYAGSEMTPIWGLTDDGVKQTGRDDRVLPRTVVYDPDLTRNLPAAIAGPSLINAAAHCVEALYAPNADPFTVAIATEGLRALAAGARRLADPADRSGSEAALTGAAMAGYALGIAEMGLHHKLCHTLGGAFDLPHAEVHAVILPHAAAYNRVATDAMERIADALGADDAPGGLYDLGESLGASTALRDLGLSEDDLDRVADLAVEKPYANPEPVTRDGIRAVLERAYHGRRP